MQSSLKVLTCAALALMTILIVTRATPPDPRLVQ
jgi:hypothetical protein